MVTTKLDNKGRISIPTSIREKLGLESGDVMFLDVQNMVLRVAKATNPFDALIEEAVEEFEAGETRSLRNFAKDELAVRKPVL